MAPQHHQGVVLRESHYTPRMVRCEVPTSYATPGRFLADTTVYCVFAGVSGLEPELTGPEPVVLPITQYSKVPGA
jgi:hypothetical protein